MGQSRLSPHEIRRLPMGNQNTNDLTLIQWQCVKAAAEYYDVTDWTAKVDTSLSVDENIEIMRREGSSPTMHELRCI